MGRSQAARLLLSGPCRWAGPDVERTAANWEVDPQGLTGVLVRVRDEYTKVPLYVTENGCAQHDYVGPDGAVHDRARIQYLDAHLRRRKMPSTVGLTCGAISCGACWTISSGPQVIPCALASCGSITPPPNGSPKTVTAGTGDVIAANALTETT